MSHPAVDAWQARGTSVDFGEHHLFVLDQPATGEVRHDPLLVLHGFPSSSFDYRHVLERLAEHRRVVLFDLLGFGLSAKPDQAYTLRLQADAAERVMEHVGLERVALLTHDVGDTVGGELLRRSLEGTLPFEVSRRVITNGSIYIEMAHLTDGQQLLLSLPDEALLAETEDTFSQSYPNGLAITFSPQHQPSADELDAQWALAAHDGGYRLLPRIIRYIEERRADQDRFTGAIETHPSPLTIVWGEVDPVAVYPMAERLHAARPDAPLVTLDGVGHYPMVEDPDRFVAAVIAGLDS